MTERTGFITPVPAALKIDLIVAVLVGNVRSISYFEGQYRIEVETNALRRWWKRRDRLHRRRDTAAARRARAEEVADHV